MRHAAVLAAFVPVVFVRAGVGTAASPARAPTVTLVRAALAPQATNDQRTAIAPAARQAFLWVTAMADGAQAIDLTKVAVVSGPASSPLIGVDSAWDGDPKQFSMIAPVLLVKTGKLSDPLEETRSEGTLSFAFTPGKAATLKVLTPPASFCLLFSVPKAFKTGTVRGLGAAPLALPALAAATP
jgi:hypothetical protein